MDHDETPTPHTAQLLWAAIKMLSPSRSLEAAGDRHYWVALERWIEVREPYEPRFRQALHYLLDDVPWDHEEREAVHDLYAQLFRELYPPRPPNL